MLTRKSERGVVSVRKWVHRGGSTILTAVLVVMISAVGVTAYAARGNNPRSNQGNNGKTNQYVLTPDVYRVVQRAQKLMSKNHYEKALSSLHNLLPKVKHNDYEHALTLQLIAQVYLLQKHYDKAAPYLAKVVDLNALPPSNENSVVYELATIYISEKKYDNAINLYKKLLSQEKHPKPQVYYLIGMGYYYKNDLHNALHYIQLAIGKVKKAHESWYRSYFVIEYRLKNFKQANTIAKFLVAEWPSEKQYWDYLSNTYLQMKEDHEALAVMALQYKQGQLKTSDDLNTLANLYLESRAPYKAGEILEKGIKDGVIKKTKQNYDNLASAWEQAREWPKAIAALSKEAQVAKDGNVYMRIAAIYLNQQDYSHANKVAKEAIATGGLKHPGQAWMIVGQSAFETKQYDDALKAFHHAEKYKRSRAQAANWIKYVENNRASKKQGS